jgi:hypothetical protein
VNTQLSNTSTIFQLSFGVNAVCAVLINGYLNQTRELVIAFTDKIKQHKPDFSIEGKTNRFREFLFRSMPGYRLVRRLFICSISLAVCSIIISFYYLVKAALYPNCLIKSHYFLFIAIVTIIINPTVYFVFFMISGTFLTGIKQVIKVGPEFVALFEMYLAWPETKESIDALIAEAKLARRLFWFNG